MKLFRVFWSDFKTTFERFPIPILYLLLFPIVEILYVNLTSEIFSDLINMVIFTIFMYFSQLFLISIGISLILEWYNKSKKWHLYGQIISLLIFIIWYFATTTLLKHWANNIDTTPDIAIILILNITIISPFVIWILMIFIWPYFRDMIKINLNKTYLKYLIKTIFVWVLSIIIWVLIFGLWIFINSNIPNAQSITSNMLLIIPYKAINSILTWVFMISWFYYFISNIPKVKRQWQEDF